MTLHRKESSVNLKRVDELNQYVQLGIIKGIIMQLYFMHHQIFASIHRIFLFLIWKWLSISLSLERESYMANKIMQNYYRGGAKNFCQ